MRTKNYHERVSFENRNKKNRVMDTRYQGKWKTGGTTRRLQKSWLRRALRPVQVVGCVNARHVRIPSSKFAPMGFLRCGSCRRRIKIETIASKTVVVLDVAIAIICPPKCDNSNHGTCRKYLWLEKSYKQQYFPANTTSILLSLPSFACSLFSSRSLFLSLS